MITKLAPSLLFIVAILMTSCATVQSDDGSIEVFFGPDAPDGYEANWIPTTRNDFFVGFRFYAPDWERLGKTWTAKRPEKIK
ncbi:MAG: DUF1214 domain-containing protein [Deltaproteobacteria bacterium]|nr:DUF1214 domain-containing protein [Deltaproteobacteria bacterium]MBW2606434.1 DUF1214 domain-containing protein [Deltaproteobacteria bacterium]